jgi:hypothetical protein
MDTKFCAICEELKPLNKFHLNPDGSVRKHVCMACYGRKWRSQLKLEMLEAFGGKCQCCGEEQPSFLTLDHIDDGGAVHRASFTSSNNEQIYADAKREGWPKDKYQLLCMNCNFAKEHANGCPHQRQLTPEMALEELKAKVFKTGKSLQHMNFEPLKLGPLAQKIDPVVLRQHRLENSKKQKQVQQLRETLRALGIEDVNAIVDLAKSSVS